MTAKRISIDQQIEEVERELAERAKVYPRLVSSGRLRQSLADFHVARMEATLRTLRWVKRHERALRALATNPPPDGAAPPGSGSGS